MKPSALRSNRRPSPIVITVPAKLATKLRRQLAALELPEERLEFEALEHLASMAEDDSYAISGWSYDNAEQAERVARRAFARGARRIEIGFGDSEHPTVVEFVDASILTGGRDQDQKRMRAEFQRAIARHPERYRVLVT